MSPRSMPTCCWDERGTLFSLAAAPSDPGPRREEADLTYLSYFEELRYPSHSGEKLLINVQALFTLSLLHVKVFLCSGSRSDKSDHKTCGRQAEG